MDKKPARSSADLPCIALLNAASREWSSVSRAIGAMFGSLIQREISIQMVETKVRRGRHRKMDNGQYRCSAPSSLLHFKSLPKWNRGREIILTGMLGICRNGEANPDVGLVYFVWLELHQAYQYSITVLNIIYAHVHHSLQKSNLETSTAVMPQIKQDINRSGWESTDFPSVWYVYSSSASACPQLLTDLIVRTACPTIRMCKC